MKRGLEDSKFVKERATPDRRRLDEIEADAASLTNEYERASIKHAKLSGSLINIKAGIQHLKELTSFYKK